MEEEDDDLYAQNGDATVKNEQSTNQDDPNEQPDIDLDDQDDEDDDDDSDDSDIDIITEHKEGAAPDPPYAFFYSALLSSLLTRLSGQLAPSVASSLKLLRAPLPSIPSLHSRTNKLLPSRQSPRRKIRSLYP